MREQTNRAAHEDSGTERQKELRSALVSGFAELMLAKRKKGEWTQDELARCLHRLDQCRDFEQTMRLAEELGFSDADLRPHVARSYRKKDLYSFLAGAESVLIKKGLAPNRLPKKPTREKYFALAEEVGISREDFEKIVEAEK